MSVLHFNTANMTLRQLLGNGLTYHVPLFQRDYSWTQDEWEDLWQDIRADGYAPAIDVIRSRRGMPRLDRKTTPNYRDRAA